MTGFDLSTITGCYVGSTPATAIYYGSSKVWPATPPAHDYSQDYLTIVSLEDNNRIRWNASDSSFTKTISVSTDDGSTWTSYTSSTTGTTLATLNTGDKLLIKGNNTSYGETGPHGNMFSSSKQYNIQGNIMSLLYGDNFIGQITLSDRLTFYMLFSSPHIVNAQNLILPATSLALDCYCGMFYGCSSLTTAPELPATSLAPECYYSMFYGCSSLTTAPELPATSLANSCYLSMFKNCTSLTTAPELPATSLADECYWYMFENCTSLTTAPELPATILAEGCYRSMFENCTSLTTAPELPATILARGCYWTMFKNCTSLNYIKCLATDISATICTDSWVYDVAATGTFVKDANTTWPSGVSGIPSGWTVIDA